MFYLLAGGKDCFSVTTVDSFEIGIRHSLDVEFRRTDFFLGSGGASGVFGLSRDKELLFHFEIKLSL